MAVPIEGYSVVAQRSRIQRLLDDGSVKIPNASSLADAHLWKCSFMALDDAQKFLQHLEGLGLNGSLGPDSDIVLANEFDRSIEPYCEWLKMAVWEKAVIGWREGTNPESVTAKAGWDPKKGSGLEFHDLSTRPLEFLRLEGNLEVFLDKSTGREVYIGRTSTPVDSLFKVAAGTIRKHCLHPGQPALSGAAAEEVVRALGMLDRVIAEVSDRWAAHWFSGKGHASLGDHEKAYAAFRRAYQLEKNVESVMRELAGSCLELRRFDEATEVAQAAVSLNPADAEALGNLAVSFLLSGKWAPARKTIDAALKIDPSDKINLTIARVLRELETGQREQPQSLQDLTKPAPPKWQGMIKRLWK